jgi:methyltransferase (TIGR00027 family)
VARHRAAHQILDRPPVLEDDVALRILGPRDRAAIEADPARYERSPIAPYLRAFLAARSRFTEEWLAEAVARGVRRYVLLGAGLDTFAYRNPHRDAGLRVFEVDHPATQRWKRSLLDRAGIAIPPEVTFVPLDFERDGLAGRLHQAGLDRDTPVFFAWLGVTMYLTGEAFESTARIAAGYGAGSAIAFDYALSPSLHGPVQRLVYEAMAARVRAGGEPWRTSFVPAELARKLTTLGFTELRDAGDAELNERYFRDRADGLRVGSLARLMMARRG